MLKRPIDQQSHQATESPKDQSLQVLRNRLELSDILLAIALRYPTKSEAELAPALRLVTVEALEAVRGFLQSVDLPSVTLTRLLQTLNELDDGNVNPLVMPRKIAHRRMDNLSTLACKAVTAAAMELLMQNTDVTKKQAASQVARSLQRTPFRHYGSQAITGRTIASWRDRFMGAHDKSDHGAFWYRTTVKIMRGKFSTSTKQAEGALALLPKILLSPPVSSTVS